jgi:hypothetical protein
MPKRSRKVQKKESEKRVFHTKQKPKPRLVSKAHLQERDENQSSFATVQRLIEMTRGARTPDGKDPLAVALGRRGGLKGGRARVDGMTKEELRASAIKAAQARWTKNKH